MHRAIFLDRDGTINEDVGDLYLPEKLIFIPRAIEALRILQKRFLLFIITNQTGIAKNAFSEKEFLHFNGYFIQLLNRYGIDIKQVFYCPHGKEENCICRKPNQYFIREIEKRYSIDLRNSYVIGDHPHDAEMAYNVGAGSVYLLTGHGRKHIQELSLEPDFIADDIYEASLLIMSRINAVTNR
ncbi:MAG: HAD family hydrolase [Nitrospira sp.]|nr:HAD family hydrolase [Nitrospira sp.]